MRDRPYSPDEKTYTMTTTHLKIAKLDDAHEATRLEKALEAVPRVQSVRVDLEANEAVVEHDAADQEDLTAAVKNVGYIAIVHEID